ncbi:MAG: BlaR1 family beta-lactam sensor/signal transducer [Lachnospiraceae bacterium]|nr:BlaR1 family beta-lactam sensor/signal transducer [Lachnospiraceae bacterium]
MTDFMIRFLICNIYISGIIGIFFTAKYLLKKHLSPRMQYNLWFILLGLLAVPFMPVQPIKLPQFFPHFPEFKNAAKSVNNTVNYKTAEHTNLLNDFAVSVSRKSPSAFGIIIFTIWILGISVMVILLIKSLLRLKNFKKSAVPLQNKKVTILYQNCLDEIHIKTNIPIYCSAFLKSPITSGLFKPCIYLPIHLISDYNSKDMRYILLHELHHCKYRDALANHLMILAVVFYWFNPIIWYALKEMYCDREVACDTSVLKMLDKKSYNDYGNSLINFAEKISFTTFPFFSGISGNMKQMKKRIINIASYKKPSLLKNLYSITAFIITASLLTGLAPMLSTYASDSNRYDWKISPENISYADLSSYFNGFEGCFVMYDLKKDLWTIYNMENATLRTSPDSTYKIYTALLGLEENIITPKDSFMPWDNKDYPFELWNKNQNLQSAMQNSVNWYFQSIDKQLGKEIISKNIHELGYGNENVSGDVSSYWLESSLKISPVEQVKLLTRLHENQLNFSPDNINAVKNSIHISTFENVSLYGKTGTGCINEQDVNGWFIGYVEISDYTYCFAANIHGKKNATGSNATEIALSILSDILI